MKKSLFAVLLALSFAGCSDENDSSDNDNSGSNSSTPAIETADDSSDSSDSTSDPFNNDPIVIPSNTEGEGSNADRFITRFDSTESYDFWGCLAEQNDNKIQMFLVKSDADELLAHISVNDDEFISSTWSVTAAKLTVVPSSEYSDLEFSKYSFGSNTEWSAELLTGTYNDAVNCVLYDQDNQAVNSASSGGGSSQNDSAASTLTKDKLTNPANSDGNLNDLWACKSDADDPFIVAYLTTGEMLISVNGGDVGSLEWSIDVSKSTIYWQGESDTFEFNQVDFQNANSHSGYFQGVTEYQCVREKL